MRKRIGITLGDPAGIGPEIIRSALASGKLPEADYRLLGESEGHSLGQPTPDSARAAQAALEESARLAIAHEIDAVVTGPIHKARMYEIGFEFPGQTEFFAARCGVENFAMLLTGAGLTVALVTTHIPLGSVTENLRTAEIVRVGSLLAEFSRPAWRFSAHRRRGIESTRGRVRSARPRRNRAHRAGRRRTATDPCDSRRLAVRSHPTPFFTVRSRENSTRSFACITIRD